MRLTIPYCATIAAICLVSQAAIAGGLFPKVVVTVAPLKPYVDEIMRGQGESISLLRPGQDPHSFALAPSQAKALDEADIVIVPDLAMNPFLKRTLANKPKIMVIELSHLPGADPLPYEAANPWLEKMKQLHTKPGDKHEDDDEHEAHPTKDAKPLNDPHFWLDPARMAALAGPLAHTIAQKAPEARATLIANSKTLATHLHREVIPAMREMLNKRERQVNGMEQPEIPFITYHAAYQYFLARFNLTHYGEITTRPEEVMGGKTLVTLLGGSEKVRVRCLIGESEGTLMKRVAQATGAKIVLLSPEQLVDRKDVDALDWIQNGYDRLMYKTAQSFAECL